MLIATDPLSLFFLGCFLFGGLFIVISLFSGLGHGVGHIGHVGHVGHIGHTGATGATHISAAGHAPAGVSFINPSSILAFLVWFGALGYLFKNFTNLSALLGLAFAIGGGLLGAAMIFYFLSKVLIPAQTVMNPSDYELPGTIGRVNLPIRANSVGEVIYVKANSKRSVGARSIDGQPISRETEVVIVSYDKGIAQVQPWRQFLDEAENNKQ